MATAQDPTPHAPIILIHEPRGPRKHAGPSLQPPNPPSSSPPSLALQGSPEFSLPLPPALQPPSPQQQWRQQLHHRHSGLQQQQQRQRQQQQSNPLPATAAKPEQHQVHVQRAPRHLCLQEGLNADKASGGVVVMDLQVRKSAWHRWWVGCLRVHTRGTQAAAQAAFMVLHACWWMSCCACNLVLISS